MRTEKYKSDLGENSIADVEIMKTPKIQVQEVRGVNLLSVLLKAQRSNWGETEVVFAKGVAKYFEGNSLECELTNLMSRLFKQGVDEEILFNIALIYQHPEREDIVKEIIRKHKPHVKNLEQTIQGVLDILEIFDDTFSGSILATKLDMEIHKDASERLRRINEARDRIESIIDFFKPDKRTTDVRRVVFIPVSPLFKKDSGRAFLLSEECLILSNRDNFDNQDHEFCHCIINPIVEKVGQRLTINQKRIITDMASGTLRRNYGDGYFSLLCEEFVRTYNDIVKKGKRPATYTDFENALNSITEEEFQEEVFRHPTLQQQLERLEITTLDELRKKSKEYYDEFVRNPLRDLVFQIYEEYKRQNDMNFEQIVLKVFPARLTDLELSKKRSSQQK